MSSLGHNEWTCYDFDTTLWITSHGKELTFGKYAHFAAHRRQITMAISFFLTILLSVFIWNSSEYVSEGEIDKSDLNQVMSWWRHQIETFSALLAICAGNSPVTGESPAMVNN